MGTKIIPGASSFRNYFYGYERVNTKKYPAMPDKQGVYEKVMPFSCIQLTL
jgi:hypothetical protein